jgi:glutathione S-transferase
LTVLTLYGRPDCHLCDEARATIERLRGDLRPFELREVDIDSDDALLSAYLERIPVLEVDGEIVSELVLEPEDLRVALELENE